jgi:hypothetical protein
MKKQPSKTVAVPNVTERAMLISLSIGYWTGKTSDDSVVDELTKSHDTEKDVHDYRRRLVKAEALKGFKGVRSRARAYLHDKTSPWIDGGTRILASPLFMKVSEEMRKFKTEWDNEVAEFLRKYPTLMAAEKKRQGSLFNPGDYPTAQQLVRKFSWEQRIFPIPSKADWRIDLGDQTAGVQKQIDETVNEALKLATEDLWGRLHEVVKKLATKMTEVDPTFRDSIIGNIQELVSTLSVMNVANDPKLEEMRKTIEEQLAGINPDELREDAKARKKTKDAADKLLAAMSAYVGGGQ